MAKKAELATELEQLSQSSVYEKKFTISTAWCFAINNIDYIRTSIAPLAKDLGLQNITDALAEHNTQEKADRCRNALQLMIDNATDTVNNKIIDLLQVVAKKMVPAISRYVRWESNFHCVSRKFNLTKVCPRSFRYLMEGAELIDTTSNAMDRLLQYLDNNLLTLRNNLNEDNFKRILLVIWEIISQTLLELINANLEVFIRK
jgi:NADPH-dependent curcumin reductase CurA